MNLQTASWPDLTGGVDVAVVPLGSCEQHGPHLPFDTDTRIATAVARATVAGLRARGVSAVLTPAIEFGASGEHQHFPGTVSIGHHALHLLLVEFGRSACEWARRVVFVNGHGGNLPAVPAAVRRLRDEGRDVSWVSCEPVSSGTADADAHAGRTETSLLLAIAPQAVRMHLAEAGTCGRLEELFPVLRRDGVVAVAPNGVLGDPCGASAAEGKRLLSELADATVDAIVGRTADSADRGRPLARHAP